MVRMQVEGSQSAYEVFCRRCQVSFPIGTRSCFHCGTRLGRERPEARGQEARRLAAPPRVDELSEEEIAPRGRFLSPFTMMWLLLALAGALYRQCG